MPSLRVSRVAFPIGAGLLIDRFGVGVPFWLSALLVLATVPLTWTLSAAGAESAEMADEARRLAAADVTGEIRVEPGGNQA